MQVAMDEENPTNGKRRKYRSTEEIVSRILEAAMIEFKKNGFDRSTTANIAKRAEVVEPQIFRHFGSKSKLFRSAIFETLSQQLDEISKEYHWEESGLMDARRETGSLRHTERLQAFLLDNSDLIRSLFIANAYGAFEAPDIGINDSLANYFQLGTSIMERKASDSQGVPPRLMVRITFGAILGCVMFREWLFPPGVADEKEIRHSVSQFILAGLDASTRESSPKPKKGKAKGVRRNQSSAKTD